MKVFANHCHVFEEQLRPHGSIETLKRTMDEAGIDKAVAFAPFKNDRQVSAPEVNQNRWLAGAIKDSPDIIGFGTIDFERTDLREQTEEIAELGLKGIKLHPAAQEFKVNGERAYEVYEAAQRHGLFLTFHTGVHWHRLSDYAMLLFDDLTYDFPDLKFSMEHMGGYCFFKDALAVMVNRRGNAKDPHVFSGWTSIYDPGLWYLTDEQLYTMVALGGETTHIFGTDFPHNKGPQLKAAIDRILNLNISEEAKARILGQNLADALQIKL